MRYLTCVFLLLYGFGDALGEAIENTQAHLDTIKTGAIFNYYKSRYGDEWGKDITSNYQITQGTTRNFFVFPGRTWYLAVTFVDSCDGAYVFTWSNKESELAKSVLRIFPEIYRKTTELWGEPDFDIDGNKKIFILIYPFHDSSDTTAAGLADIEGMVPSVKSNWCELVQLNSSRLIERNELFLRSTLAHEYMHLLEMGYDYHDDRWLREGLGVLNEALLGYLTATTIIQDLSQYDDFLLWEGKEVIHNYSTAGVFLFWLYLEYGKDTMVRIMRDPHNGQVSVERATGDSWRTIWHKYLAYLANYGKYGKPDWPGSK